MRWWLENWIVDASNMMILHRVAALFRPRLLRFSSVCFGFVDRFVIISVMNCCLGIAIHGLGRVVVLSVKGVWWMPWHLEPMKDA